MSRFTVTALPLAGLNLIERHRLGDSRGFLSRIFCAEELSAAGWHKPIAQINQTYTAQRGTVRGLHFQHPPHDEMKVVSCLRGAIWDVAVDLRAKSPTFLQWHAQELSSINNRALLIPEGFAHGFQTLSDDCELIYLHSAAHAAGAEGGLSPHDPLLSIEWPLPITELSNRDAQHLILNHHYKGMTL